MGGSGGGTAAKAGRGGAGGGNGRGCGYLRLMEACWGFGKGNFEANGWSVGGDGHV